MDYPKITIVTPSFNQGAFLEQTIKSVVGQKYPNLEYIIIDGGSTDNSIEIINKYEKYLTCWLSESDRGQSHAINKGFEKATGEIITWLNSDDYYNENSLFEVANSYIKEPNAGIIFGDSIDVDQNGIFIKYGSNSWFSYRALKHDLLICQPSIFFKHELLLKYGFLDESYHYCMDLELFLRIGRTARFAFIRKPLVFFRWHDRSKSTKDHFKWSIERKEIHRKNNINMEGLLHTIIAIFYKGWRRLNGIRKRNFSRSRHALIEFINNTAPEKLDAVYICIGFSGFKMSGDKNNYLDLLEKLASSGLKFLVISISDPFQGAYALDEKSHNYRVLHIKRPFHACDPLRFWKTNNGFLTYKHKHHAIQEHFERITTFFFWGRLIKLIMKKYKPEIVHYLDVFLAPKYKITGSRIVEYNRNRFELFFGKLIDYFEKEPQ